MAAVTLNEVKLILGITDTNQDAIISTLIPICTEQLKQYCNNRFWDSRIKLDNNTIYFTSNNVITIDSGYSFLDYYFKSGMEVEIVDSIYNDELYTLANVTATEMTTNETTIVDEDEDITISIYRVKYPAQVKQVLALMIKEQIEYNNSGGGGVSSYRLGDYSISYNSNYSSMSDGLKQLIKSTIGRYASVK